MKNFLIFSQTTFLTLDEVIKITNRRVNAIEHVIIPRFANTIAYIVDELEELGKLLELIVSNLFQSVRISTDLRR